MPSRGNTYGNADQPQRRTVSSSAPHAASPTARRMASQGKTPQASQQPSARPANRQKVRPSGQQVSRPQASRPQSRPSAGSPTNPRLQSFVREGAPAQSGRNGRPARPAANAGQRAPRPSNGAPQRSSRPSANAGQRAPRPTASTQALARPARNTNEKAITVRRTQPGASNARINVPSRRRRGFVGKIVKAVVALAVVVGVLAGIGLGAYTALTPASFNIKVNNQLKTVDRFTSIDSLIKDGVVSPVPGDHLAVDGTVLVEGGGVPYYATVNGEEPRYTFLPLSGGDILEIRDGDDTTEKYTTTQETIPVTGVEDGFGAIHAYVAGTEGLAEVRVGSESGLTTKVILTPMKEAVFYEYNADVGTDKVIALTFDDGPWPESTAQVLDILDRYNVKATFFTVGDRIDDTPEALTRMQNSGHQICTHTWSHASGSGKGTNLTFMSTEEQIEELTKGLEAIEAVTGTEASKVFRAPGGNYTGDVVWTLQEYVTYEIGWNIDTEDWRQPGAEVIADRIMGAKSGDIVLMHDGGGDRTQTVEALEMAIPYLQEQGYTFVTIDELLAYNRAVDMM